MIEITSHRQGAILNHHHGEETAGHLKITVSGISESGRPVKVNGVPADFADPVKSGDELEIILKTPDGLEFKPLDDLEIPVRNDNLTTPAQVEPKKKFSIRDFIRTD